MTVGGVDVKLGVKVGPGVVVGGAGVGDRVAVDVGRGVLVEVAVSVGRGVRVGVAVGGNTGVAVRSASSG